MDIYSSPIQTQPIKRLRSKPTLSSLSHSSSSSSLSSSSDVVAVSHKSSNWLQLPTVLIKCVYAYLSFLDHIHIYTVCYVAESSVINYLKTARRLYGEKTGCSPLSNHTQKLGFGLVERYSTHLTAFSDGFFTIGHSSPSGLTLSHQNQVATCVFNIIRANAPTLRHLELLLHSTELWNMMATCCPLLEIVVVLQNKTVVKRVATTIGQVVLQFPNLTQLVLHRNLRFYNLQPPSSSLPCPGFFFSFFFFSFSLSLSFFLLLSLVS